jgi:serine protease Do
LTRQPGLTHGPAMRDILLLLGVVLASSPAWADKPPPLPDSAAPLPGKPPPLGALPPLPAPAAPQGQASASGSGFIVADGAVLTANHVVESCKRMAVRNAAGQRVAAPVAASDPHRDLALLRVPANFGPALVLRDAPAVKIGESVVTYGFPLSGLLSSGPTLTTGNISALSGLRDNPLHVQISAPVQPGNSGGPLLDAQGHVVGVVVSKLNAARIAQMTGGDIPQNVNFAIKGTEAAAFLAAGRVPFSHTPSDGPELKPSTIGEQVNASVVFIQCYR